MARRCTQPSPPGAVSAINTTTLQETARYPLPSGYAAYSVALQSGMIWVSYRNAGLSEIGAIDPANTGSFTAGAVPVP